MTTMKRSSSSGIPTEVGARPAALALPAAGRRSRVTQAPDGRVCIRDPRSLGSRYCTWRSRMAKLPAAASVIVGLIAATSQVSAVIVVSGGVDKRHVCFGEFEVAGEGDA